MNPMNSNNGAAAARRSTDARVVEAVRNAMRLADAGDLERALTALNRSRSNCELVRKARGVCLMRAGRTTEALQLYRGLVLASGGTWPKPGVPDIYQINFATVLLLAGHPAGCRDMLHGLRDDAHPSIVRLRRALDRWRQTLNFWQRMIWIMGSEPDAPVVLDFVPGEFEELPAAAHVLPSCEPAKPSAVSEVEMRM